MEMADNFEKSVMTVVESLSSATTQMQSSAETMSATADQTNQQIALDEPWKTVKVAASKQQTWQNLTVYLNAFYKIVILLAPILPDFAGRCAQLLGLEAHQLGWQHIDQPQANRAIKPFTPLKQRLQAQAIAALKPTSPANLAKSAQTPPQPPKQN